MEIKAFMIFSLSLLIFLFNGLSVIIHVQPGGRSWDVGGRGLGHSGVDFASRSKCLNHDS